MSLPTDINPVSNGVCMPAEWEPHRRTWMCWPSRLEAFGSLAKLGRAKQAFARVAQAISAFEPVAMVASARDVSEATLATGGSVEIVEISIDDGWARDSGPTFVKDHAGHVAGVQWQFNAWGKKYRPSDNDARLADRLLSRLGLQTRHAHLVCEGGALQSNGSGTILTTEQCLLNPNRNPGRTKADVEGCLGAYLGARKVLWLGSGFSDDETDGHIDNIACFVAPSRATIGVPASRMHPDYPAIQESLRRLAASTDANGNTIEIVELPQPQIMRRAENGKMLQMSYVNYYLVNGALIMPAFDDPNDEAARAVLASCFPDRQIIQIDARAIVEGGGGIHCITQQEPLP